MTTKNVQQATDEPIAEQPTYTKSQFVQSTRYELYKDVLSALLDESKTYTHDEAQLIIDNFLNGEVK